MLNYGIRLLLSPHILGSSHSDELVSLALGEVKRVFFEKLEEDGLVNNTKQGGMAVEIYLKDLTQEEQIEVRK